MLLSVLFLLAYIAALALCIYLAVKRPWLKSLLSLIAASVSFAEADILTRLFLSSFGGILSNALKEGFLELLGMRNEATVRESAMLRVSAFAVTIILGVISFIIFFALLLAVNSLIKRLLFRLFAKKKYSAYSPEKKLPVLSVAIALISFMVVSFAIIYPLGAGANITTSASKATGYYPPSSVLTNPICRLYGPAGRSFFDSLTRTEYTDEFVNSDEAQRGTEIYFSAMKITKGLDADDTAVEQIAESLRTSYIMTDFTSELAANAASSWKSGLKFMNKSLKIPAGRNGELVLDVLDIVSRWERENLVSDIETTVNIYKLLKSNGINKLSDGEALAATLADPEFVKSLFHELCVNGDFIEIIPKLMKFGVGSAVDAMGMEMNDDYVIEFDAEDLTEEEWLNEAEALSTIMNRINEMKKEDGKIDAAALLKDLYEIKNSKLLTNLFTNILIQLLANMAEGAV